MSAYPLNRTFEMVLRFDLDKFLKLFIDLIPWLPSEMGRTNVQ